MTWDNGTVPGYDDWASTEYKTAGTNGSVGCFVISSRVVCLHVRSQGVGVRVGKRHPELTATDVLLNGFCPGVHTPGPLKER